MAWTTPRTWVPGEVVTAPLLNAHVRDNLDYLKTNPQLGNVNQAAVTNTNNAGAVLCATLAGVAIPSDVGAVYVETWSHQGTGTTTMGAGQNDQGWYATEASAGFVLDGRRTSTAVQSVGPFYARSADFAWAGTTRTVYLYVVGYSSSGGCNGFMGPCTIRIMRSY